jgi:hypothetical protein
MSLERGRRDRVEGGVDRSDHRDRAEITTEMSARGDESNPQRTATVAARHITMARSHDGEKSPVGLGPSVALGHLPSMGLREQKSPAFLRGGSSTGR